MEKNREILEIKIKKMVKNSFEFNGFDIEYELYSTKNYEYGMGFGYIKVRIWIDGFEITERPKALLTFNRFRR